MPEIDPVVDKGKSLTDPVRTLPVTSRKKGTIALMVSSYASLALVMVKGIVLIPLYLSYIDERLFGAWLATGSIVAYFGFLDFGLNGVLVQRVGASFGKGDIDRLGSVMGTGLMIGMTLCWLPAVLGVWCAPWIPEIVKVSGVQASQLSLAFTLAAVGTSLMLCVYCVGGVLTALQRQIVHGTVLVVGDLLGIIVILLLLINGFGLVAIPAGAVVRGLISLLGDGVSLWWLLRKKMPEIPIKFSKGDFKDLAYQSVWQFGARSSAKAARESDNLIVAALLDPRLCTVLTLTKKASDILSMLVRHFAGAFLPSLSHLHGENDPEKFKRIALLLFKITSLFGVCFIGSYLCFNESFMEIWVGSKFFGGYLLTFFFAVYSFFMIVVTTLYNVVFAKGEMVTVAKSFAAEAFLRIPLCFALVWLWGIEGTAFAAAVAIIPTSFWMQAKKAITVLELSKEDVLNIAKSIGTQIVVASAIGIIFSHWKSEGIIEFISFGGGYLICVLSINLLLDKELGSKVVDTQKKLFNKYLKPAFKRSY